MKQLLLLLVFLAACTMTVEETIIEGNPPVQQPETIPPNETTPPESESIPTSTASDGCGNVLPVNGECPEGCVDYGVPKHCVPEDYDCNDWGDCELGPESTFQPTECGEPDAEGNCPEGCWDFGSPLGCVPDGYNPDIQ